MDPFSSEASRLAALRRLSVLDTPPEPALDAIARSAADLLRAPMAMVSLVDEHRQFFKARHGLEQTETPRAGSFCSQAIAEAGLFVVPDATKDERFREHPMVVGPPGIRFYAAAPLVVGRGDKVGTLCVVDTLPHPSVTQEQGRALEVLGREASSLLLSRRQRLARERARAGLSAALMETLRALALKARELVDDGNQQAKAIRLLATAELAAQLGEELTGPDWTPETPMPQQRYDLAAVVSELAAALEGAVKGRRILVSAEGDCAAAVDVDRLTEALGRLLEDALVAAATPVVRVVVREEENGVSISTAAQAMAPLGSVGSALVEELAVSYGGELVVDSAANGFSVAVWLPRRPRSG